MNPQHYTADFLFQNAYQLGKTYIIPYIEQVVPLKGKRVLEIGCGRGGLLQACIEAQAKEVVGLDIDQQALEQAKNFLDGLIQKGKVKLLTMDVYDYSPEEPFDVVLLKDVIEHIPQQDKFLKHLRKLVQGYVWIGFPPWQMPFGGHQQLLSHPFLSRLPYFHLLPKNLYKKILEWGNTPLSLQNMLLEIKDTGISIERFECIAQQANFKIVKRTCFFFNPSYRFRFGLPIWKVPFPFSRLKWIRNFYTTAVYYVLATI